MSDVLIEISNLSQTYKLYSSPTAMAIDALGLGWLNRGAAARSPLFEALHSINVQIKRGERVGIIGRNGAGKTTLLKLITGNFAPSKGSVNVKGRIQSLMDQGVGFHPEFTGRENIRSALVYNGITGDEVRTYENDILDFVELGEFIDQPIKTYSLGMKARLGFAVATAVRPEILIVDEVLGAGDAYFTSKSALRMKKLTSHGVTLLLVSHSNSQILQFCDRAIWLDRGRVVADGAALEVVKMYDAHIKDLESQRLGIENESPVARTTDLLQETYLKSKLDSVSRWRGSGEVEIKSLEFLCSTKQPRAVFKTGEEMVIRLAVQKNDPGQLPIKAVIYVFSLDGRPLLLFTSDEVTILAKNENVFQFLLEIPQLQLGSGEYVVSAALYKKLDYDNIGEAQFYDLVDRSYRFKVYNRFESDYSQFVHPATWRVLGFEQ